MIWNLREHDQSAPGRQRVHRHRPGRLRLDDDIENDDGTLNMDELGAGAQGFFVENVDLGLVLATAVPFTGPRR
jgi:hypothetical protein